jgi:aspartate 1-decarboxylase
VQPGDLVIILSYADMNDAEAAAHKPHLVFVDPRNVIAAESAAAVLVSEA